MTEGERSPAVTLITLYQDQPMINFQPNLRYHFLLSLDYLADCWAYGLDPQYTKCQVLGDVLSVAITGDDPAIEKIAAIAL